MNKDTVTIFNPKIAKDLIQSDYKLVDINQHRDHKLKTVFYFKRNDGLIERLESKHDLIIK